MTQKKIFKRMLKNIDNNFNKYINKFSKKIPEKKKISSKNIITKYKNNEDVELINFLENNDFIVSSNDILDSLYITNNISELNRLFNTLTAANFMKNSFLTNCWFRNNLNNLNEKYFFNKIVQLILEKIIKGREQFKIKYDINKETKIIISKLTKIKNNKNIFNLNIIDTFFTASSYDTDILKKIN
jgi:hypothetical protein